MVNREEINAKSFTSNLKQEIISKKLSLEQKKQLLNGYFRNNYFPIEDNGKIKLVISNVYESVLEYITRCIQSLNLKLKFDKNETEIKLGKKTHFVKIYGLDLLKFEQEIGLRENLIVSNSLIENQAFLTGAFLAGGSMNEPKHQNHFEIRCFSQELGDAIVEILAKFNVTSLSTYHKNKLVIYLKKISSISDALKIMNCSQTVLKFEAENVKSCRDQCVTRSTQLEFANLAKTVTASSVQIKQINVIKNTPY